MALQSFPIHCRTTYSFLQGAFSPQEICNKAKEWGTSAVGITDINSFYGLPAFLNAVKQAKLKPIIGTDLRIRENEEYLTAYCMNRNGYRRLCGIITNLRLNSTKGKYELINDLLDGGWEGLVLASENTLLLHTLRQKSASGLYAALTFGRPFRGILSDAKKMNIPSLAINRGVFSDNRTRRLHALLRAIDLNLRVKDLPPEEYPDPAYRFANPEEILAYFQAVPEAIKAQEYIVRESDPSGIPSNTAGNKNAPQYVFPRFAGLTEEEAYRILLRLCLKGVSRRYGKMNSPIENRLKYELNIIRKKQFSSYFLVVYDVVSRSRRTCGRGSSASSIVSYLLGITHVDPLKHKLFFERFLNMGRKDPPDIDVDFPWDEREHALAYMFDTYPGCSGMVADHITFAARSSIRESAKAFGIMEEEISTYTDLWRRGCYETIPLRIRNAAETIRGIPRHLGTHPGGVVITPEPITTYTHIQPSPLGWPVIAWDKDGAEDSGLIKIDLLGNRSLGVLRDTLTLINPRRRQKIEWESFNPLQDTETRKQIEAGNTLGVFYVESPATRQLLKKMGQGDFPRLVIASSIIRPAANRYISEFVRRLKGGEYDPLLPVLDNILQETFGIMVYQEDVSRAAIAVSSFTPEEADRLRKALTRKDRGLWLKDFRERFFTGGITNGVNKHILDTLWDMILSFEGYSFCKSHSASYALVSYRLAFLKRYHPLEFFTSVINNGGGFYSRQVYLNEVRRLGFPILFPDVNMSEKKYTVEDKSLRVGLGQIKDLSLSFIEAVLQERRRGGLFKHLDDFLSRIIRRGIIGIVERRGTAQIHVSGLGNLRMLVKSGALDGISHEYNQPQIFWIIANYGTKRFGEDELFSPGEAWNVPDCIKDYHEGTKIMNELETMGLIISRHPIEIFRSLTISKNPICDSRKIHLKTGKIITIPGILIVGKEVATSNSKAMSFFSFEDEYGIFETVFFPKEYQEWGLKLHYGKAYLITAKVAVEFGTSILEVRKALPIGNHSSG